MDLSLIIAVAGGVMLAFLPEWMTFVMMLVRLITGFFLLRARA